MTNKPYALRWTVFGITAAMFVLSQFYRAAVAVISPLLISELGLDNRGLSTVSAAFFYAFALSQIPLAVYLDRIGARRLMLGLNGVAVIGALVFAAAHTLSLLVIGRILLGIGMACNLMGTFKLISRWFEADRFATLTTLVFSLGTAGNIFATSPLVVLVQVIGWRSAFVLMAGVNLALMAALLILVRDTPPNGACTPFSAQESPGPTGATLATLAQLLRNHNYWIISLGTFCRYGTYAAIQTLYAGPFLMIARDLSPVAAGNVILMMNLGFILSGPLWGWISDHRVNSRKRVIICGLLAMATLIVALAYLPTTAGALGMTVLFFLLGSASSTGGIMYSHIKEQLPLAKAGAAMTGINFFTMIGPAVYLQGLGLLMQQTYPTTALQIPAFRLAFWVSAAGLAAVAGLYGFTRDTTGRRHPH